MTDAEAGHAKDILVQLNQAVDIFKNDLLIDSATDAELREVHFALVKAQDHLSEMVIRHTIKPSDERFSA